MIKYLIELGKLINSALHIFDYLVNYKINVKKMELLTSILPYGLDGIYLNNRKKYYRRTGCVLFTDIVSYCKLADTYSDVIIYLILDDMYSRFDTIIKKYKALYKIETIGDAYMVIGDVREDEDDSKVQMIQFALELLDEIKKVRTPSHMLQIRIGIHFGPYVISVLGKINPRLCFIGKNVNLAARLQSTAEPNTIQISESFYNDISKYDFRSCFTKNEKVFLKNIGEVVTFSLKERIQKSLIKSYSFSLRN
jgi:class 3 adenylate cyclase